MSFTTGGLFHLESVQLAMLYLDIEDWDAVREKVIAENILQSRTVNTLKRVCREIISRLKTLNSDELHFFVQATRQEQIHLLWLAICRRYRFISDFAIEVLREHSITMNTDLTYEDFDAFFNRKSEWHKEIEEIRPTTRNKLRQVLFKMLREADFLTANNTITPALLSPELLETMRKNNGNDLLIFPAVEMEFKGVSS